MKFLSKVSYSLDDKIAVDELLNGVENLTILPVLFVTAQKSTPRSLCRDIS